MLHLKIMAQIESFRELTGGQWTGGQWTSGQWTSGQWIPSTQGTESPKRDCRYSPSTFAALIHYHELKRPCTYEEIFEFTQTRRESRGQARQSPKSVRSSVSPTISRWNLGAKEAGSCVNPNCEHINRKHYVCQKRHINSLTRYFWLREDLDFRNPNRPVARQVPSEPLVDLNAFLDELLEKQ